MTIGENIKRLREGKKMTQEELAEKIGIRQPYLSQLERGTKILNMPTAIIIAEVWCTHTCGAKCTSLQ